MNHATRHGTLLMALLVLLAVGAAIRPFGAVMLPAQPGDTPRFSPLEERLTSRLLRIGYQRREATGHPGAPLLEELRRHLLAQDNFRAELEAEGYTGIGLFPCDGPYDMLRRLNAQEFDLAFTPANIYAQLSGGYTPMLKSRRPEDRIAPSDRVWRQGVVFVTPRCPLFAEEEITREALAEYLARERLAVVSTQSIAGFQAPLLRLAVEYDIVSSAGGYLWFDSSEEVVKGVIAGLADIGACDESALDRVLRRSQLEGRREELVRIILRTDPITTDPIVTRERLAPRNSVLGRELRNAIRDFARDGRFGDIQYTTATEQEYRPVIELNREFVETVGELAR